MSSSDELVAKIRAIGCINREIIERIDSMASEMLQCKNYYVQQKDDPMKGLFYVEEVIENSLGSTICENWKKSISLKPPLDLFNDKLDYNCQSYKDMVRLNDSLLNIIDKYMFLDLSRAQIELQKFKINFEIIQTYLGEVDMTFYNLSNDSRLTFYQTELEEINQGIKELFMNQDVIFGPKFSWQTPCTSHIVNKNRATLISGQYGCLLSNRGYTTGVHRWSLRLITRTSTCMVGVAPDTVSRSGSVNNYNTNGFYMDLNTGTLYSGPPFSYSNRTLINRGINSGSILIVILDCNNKTLTFNVDGTDYLAYENLPITRNLFLAWDNNTTAGSEIELI